MTFSGVFTEVRPSGAFSARSAEPNMFVLHGAAMTNLDALSSMIVNQSKQVSAHGGFKDERGIGWVSEEYRAWSLSDAYWDSRAFVTENANESTDGYTFSSGTQESIARWIADVCKRRGLWPHRSGDPTTWTVIGHSEVYTIHRGSYATACPTTLDLDWITARAQQLLTGTITNEGSDMPVMLTKTIGGTATAPKFRWILTDGNHKEITEDQATANNWQYGFCEGKQPTVCDATAPNGNFKLKAFAYLEQLNLPPFGSVATTIDFDDADAKAVAAALAPLIPGGVTAAQITAAVKAGMPKKITGTLT